MFPYHMYKLYLFNNCPKMYIDFLVGPLLLFLDQALSSHEMLEVQGFQAGTHAGGL